jgi:low affinity Fe/Cu permease
MRASLPVASRTSDHPHGSSLFARMANATAAWTGRPATFLLASGTVLVWAITGPAFHYSDTWQLIVNTGTTIVTFLMVFLIQNTQNRDTMALQIKLAELILSLKTARNELALIEYASDEELQLARDTLKAKSKKASSSC